MELNILTRELTPFEQLVCEHLCDGFTNSAIAFQTAHSDKVIENTVSRVAKAFSIRSDGNINVRVLLALAYRSHFGDKALDKLGVACQHMSVDSNGQQICSKHTE